MNKKDLKKKIEEIRQLIEFEFQERFLNYNDLKNVGNRYIQEKDFSEIMEKVIKKIKSIQQTEDKFREFIKKLKEQTFKSEKEAKSFNVKITLQFYRDLLDNLAEEFGISDNHNAKPELNNNAQKISESKGRSDEGLGLGDAVNHVQQNEEPQEITNNKISLSEFDKFVKQLEDTSEFVREVEENCILLGDLNRVTEEFKQNHSPKISVGCQMGGMQTTSGVALRNEERLTSSEKGTKENQISPAEDAQPQNNCVPAPLNNPKEVKT